MTQTGARRGRGRSPQKTAETEARIRAAAEARFLSEGFAATRMVDVARDAGVAKGTLYLYYPTKEALFEAVIHHFLGHIVQRFEVGPGEAGESSRDFVLRVMLPLVTDQQAPLRMALFRLILMEGPRFPAVMAAYRRVALDPLLAAARRIGARARLRGEIGSDALERLPILFIAPGPLFMFWNTMFPAEPIEAEALFRGYYDLILGPRGVSLGG